MTLYTDVKNHVGICEYIEIQTQSTLTKTGSTFRVNPCLLCGHRDCFTIYPESNSFKCFSCDKAGNVITLERLLNGHDSNFSAAKSLVQKFGLDGKIERSVPSRTTTKATTKKGKPKSPESLPPERGREVRQVVADWYHQQFLNSSEALRYQTEIRGHSLETLKRFKIGYSGKNDLIVFIKKLDGYEINDLIGIGLVKKYRGQLRPTIPRGFYVYPHFIKDMIGNSTIKKHKAKKHELFQIQKKYADPEWLGLGQDALGADNIIIVEGENDFLSVSGKAQYENVFATIGNFNSSNILKKIEKVATGKTFYLVFDNDPAGRKYTERYAPVIRKGGGRPLVVDIPKGCNDIDDYLRRSKSPKADFEKLLSTAKEPVKSTSQEKSSGETDPEEVPSVPIPKSINVIGEDESGSIVMESIPNRKIYSIRLRDLTYDQLVQVGGRHFSNTFYRSEKRKLPGQSFSFLSLREKIIREAAKIQLGHIRWIGQGIHSLDSGKAILVNGGRAYLWDNQKLDPFIKPRIGLKLIQKETGRHWIDEKRLKQVLIEMNVEKATRIQAELINLFQQWGFQGQFDEKLLTGWFLAQIIQTFWQWRVHMWITGPQSSGKSLLLECLSILGGRLSLKLEGQSQTEAGLRQSLGSNAFLAIIDEAERSNKSREAVIHLLRSGRGGIVAKGSSTQKATFFEFKHMVCLASIEMGLDRAAEISRFFVLDMEKDNTRRPVLPGVEDVDRLRSGIFGYALWSAKQAQKLVRKKVQYKGVDNRLIDSFRIPASMLAVAHGNPDEKFIDYLELFLADWSRRRSDEVEEDEAQLLNAILTSTVRTSVSDEAIDLAGSYRSHYDERGIFQLLQAEISNNGSGPGIYAATLAANGVKLCSDGIFVHCPTIERKLLKDTKWRGFGVAGVLKRLPGVERVQRRLIESVQTKGLLIPRNVCFPDEDIPF